MIIRSRAPLRISISGGGTDVPPYPEEKGVYDGERDLVKGAINTLLEGNGDGVVLFIHSDAPPGSGLGSSSTMAVTLIGLIRQWLQ